MKFKEKASSLALCAVLLGTSIAPVSAATKTEIVGANRYETAAKIADKMGNYDTAILVNADKSLADGLSASSLAGKENAPILLVKKDSIPAATMQRLRNVKRVYVIGGEAAVSQRVVDSLGDVTYIRIQGANRIETSENVAEIVGNYNKAFIVNGNKGEADAMSVASVAARDKAPIILTNGKSSNEVKRPGVKYYVVGGSAVVSNSLVNKFGAIRLSGSDRYKTNRVVVNKFYPNSSKLYFTKGNPLVDALTVSPLAKNDGVVLVSAKSDNSILNGKDTVQVGGMNFGGSAKPDGQKPEENKPVKPEQKPDGGTQKPEENKPVKPEQKPEENKPVKPDGNKPSGKNTAPVLTSMSKISVIEKGQNINFSKYGIKAIDAEEGDITSRVTYVNLPDTAKVGRFTFIAKVTDKGGLTSTLELVVRINESKADLDVNSPAYQSRVKAEFDRLLSEYRSKKGVKAVSIESRTQELARLKINHLIDYNYFSHTYDDSVTKYYEDKWKKGETYGYKLWIWDIYPYVQGYGKGSVAPLGENLYRSTGFSYNPEDLAKEIFTTWVNSPGHNAALLNNAADYYGFEVKKAANGTTYASYEFSELVTWNTIK